MPLYLLLFSFSDTESGLLFMPVFDVAMFEKAFYRRINEKFNDTINSTRNSIQ